MNITEVRVKLVSAEGERLRAFCSVTFDGEFVVRDVKIIDGTNGPFVAMPSRKLADKCRKCGAKNHLRARFCNECGSRLNEQRAAHDSKGRVKLHADVAHPIKPACREQVQAAVLAAYQTEIERAKQPGYRPPLLDEAEEERFDGSEYDSLVTELRESGARRAEPARGPAGAAESPGGPRGGSPPHEVEHAGADAWSDDSKGVPALVPTPSPTKAVRIPRGDDDTFGAGID